MARQELVPAVCETAQGIEKEVTMTPAELLALPVGTRLHWDEVKIDGEVVEQGGDVLQIRWFDGDVLEVAASDEDIGEFAASLDVVTDLAGDEPLIVGGP